MTRRLLSIQDAQERGLNEQASCRPEDTLFNCDVCGKTLSSKHTLQVHMQLHTGQFGYYCKPCRRGFSGRTHFERHVRSHKGLKYQCDQCDKTFVDKGKLKHHMSVHTGEYKFTCNKCNKCFNARFRYLQHVNSHQ